VRVDPTNTEQSAAWDGEEGAFWANNAEHFDRAVAAYHGPFMAAAGISAPDRVLDIGCGTGQTTLDAARAATSGSALGVDLSARMVDYARQVAARDGITNVSFEHADAQVYPFTPGGFDLAISRTGAMFFGDLGAAFINIAGALRPRGRLTLLTWQGPPGNEWIREFSAALAGGRDLPTPPPDAPGPFALADPSRVRAVLSVAGFDNIQLVARSDGMWFGHDPNDAYRFVLGLLGWMLQGLDDRGTQRALDGLRATIAAHDTDHGVVYESATWTVIADRA
jgi:SAM-dependent methyltransferase